MFPMVKDLGIKGIQIDDWGSYAQSFPMNDRYIQKLYMDEAEKCGIKITSLGCNDFARQGGFVNRLGTPEGDISVLAILTALKICERMNIPVAMFPCFWKGFLNTEDDIENASEMLRFVCKYYDDTPVNISIETVMSPAKIKEVLNYVGADSLKIYYDTQNTQYFSNAYPPGELSELDIRDISEIHFKDGLMKQQACRPLGTGETFFKETVNVLKKKGYDGWCVIENYYMRPTWLGETNDPYQSIETDVKCLQEIFSSSS